MTKSEKIDQMHNENQKELNRQVTMDNGIPNYSEVCFEVKTMQNSNKYSRVKVIVEEDNSDEFELVDGNTYEYTKFRV